MRVRKTEKGAALRRWFEEEWETPKGNKEYSGSDRTFRPTVRVTEDTPATWSELTPAEKRAAKKEKKEKGRVSRFKRRRKRKEEKK